VSAHSLTRNHSETLRKSLFVHSGPDVENHPN